MCPDRTPGQSNTPLQRTGGSAALRNLGVQAGISGGTAPAAEWER